MASIQDDRGYNQGFKPCKSLDVRTERRCDYMISLMNKGNNAKVLEIGCGTGELSAMIAFKTGKKVMGVDLCKPFIEKASQTHKAENLEYHIMDFSDPLQVEKITLGKKFDYVVGNGILHHLYYKIDQSLKYIKALLVNGGKIIFQEPNIYNPYCFFIFNFPVFRKTARLEPAEMAFSKSFITKKLQILDFTAIKVEYKDFLVPGTPELLIEPVITLGDAIEKIPFMNMAAQSLYISADKR